MSARGSRPICDVTYWSPDNSPYVGITIDFNQKCKPEAGLVDLLKGLAEVQEVTASSKKLVVKLKPNCRTSAQCRELVNQAGGWVYDDTCTHGSGQPKL